MARINVSRTWRSLPKRQKFNVTILAIIAIVSFAQFIFGNIRLPIRDEAGVFSEGIVGHVKNINPLFADFNDVDRDLSQLIFSGLLRWDPVQENYYPDLAESFTRSSNGLTYTFKLRSNALWHDGSPVTLDDIYFTFKDIIQNPAYRNPIIKNAFEGIKIERSATDPQSIIFTLDKPNSYFISYMTVGILPKHILGSSSIATLEKNTFGEQPIGSGPYQVTKIRLDPDGDQVDLTVYPNYYGTKPGIQNFRFFTFSSEKEMLQSRSALHAVSKLSFESAKEIGKDDRLKNHQYTLNQFTAIYLNTESPFLQNQKMRQALNYALNKDALVLPGSLRIDTITLDSRAEDAAFAFNLDKANGILDEIKFEKKSPDANSANVKPYRYDNKGNRISLTLLVSPKIPVELAQKIKEQWEALSIEVNIKTTTDWEFYDLVDSRRYDVLLNKQSLGENRDLYPLLNSSQAGNQATQSGLNFSNFRSFRTDGLTEAIRKEKDFEDKQKLIAELSKVIIEEIPVIFISTPVYSYALDKTITSFPVTKLNMHRDRLLVLPYLLTF